MKIQYELTVKDLVSFNRRVLKKRSLVFKPYIFPILLALSFLMVYWGGPGKITRYENGELVSGTEMNFWLAWGLNFLFLLVLLLLVRYITMVRIKNQIVKNPVMTGPRELELKEGKLLYTTGHSLTEYSPAAFTEWEEAKDYYYLYLSRSIAIAVPKRAKGSDELIKQLRDLPVAGK